MAKQDKRETTENEPPADLTRIMNRLDMLDKRLDNVDSIVSAVAERVMRQPITLNVTCPKCGQRLEIALVGIEKPGR